MVFFLFGIGKDAVILNNAIKYKPICMVKEVCKCGIPVNVDLQIKLYTYYQIKKATNL